MISPELEKKFEKNRSLDGIKERYDQLCEMWINPEFAHRLSEMFCEIHASHDEVMWVSWDILQANSKIEIAQQKSRIRNISPLDEWRNTQEANDDNYLKKTA